MRSWLGQAWDLLAGRLEPALGGAPQWLDLIGANHHHTSQWEVQTEARLLWHERDPRRMPLRSLLAEAAQRYNCPVVVGETSHVGAGRAEWLHEVAGEVRAARAHGVAVQGVCVYSLVDRPDWLDRVFALRNSPICKHCWRPGWLPSACSGRWHGSRRRWPGHWRRPCSRAR
ncbi:MAG: hypothetical protein LH480_01095 [Rubrivivax sp.]|nr:hypothetical protein [Rubrivivax sp.]